MRTKSLRKMFLFVLHVVCNVPESAGERPTSALLLESLDTLNEIAQRFRKRRKRKSSSWKRINASIISRNFG